jgi:hypothetical protein
MKVRRVPNTISKRFRRKLRRSSNPFQLWLRCKRPHVWARLTRLWNYRFWEMLLSIAPCDTPFCSMAPKVPSQSVLEQWKVDPI